MVELTGGEIFEFQTSSIASGSVGDRRQLNISSSLPGMVAGESASMQVAPVSGSLESLHSASAASTSYRVTIDDADWVTMPFDLASQVGVANLADLRFEVAFNLAQFPGSERLFSMDVVTVGGIAQYAGLVMPGVSPASPTTMRMTLLTTSMSPDLSQVQEFRFRYDLPRGDGSEATLFEITEISATTSVPEPTRAVLAIAGVGATMLLRRRAGRRQRR